MRTFIRLLCLALVSLAVAACGTAASAQPHPLLPASTPTPTSELSNVPSSVIGKLHIQSVQTGETGIPAGSSITEPQAQQTATSALANTLWGPPGAYNFVLVGYTVGRVPSEYEASTPTDWVFIYHSSKLVIPPACGVGPCGGHYVYVGVNATTGLADPNMNILVNQS